MKNLVKNVLGGVIGTGVILGIFKLLGEFVEWACSNKIRFISVIIIFTILIAKRIKEELDK